jgi:hypothetical protein
LKTKDLLEMALDPRFIEGIYNYCDRWCERCPFTSRCLVYAQEHADADGPEANDINNEAFWHVEDDAEEDDVTEGLQQKDSDGSIKVALIGMDRSIGAWGRLKEEFPEQAGDVLPLLVHLERLRRKTEHTFPNARNFIRPGFDEAPDFFIS